MTDNMNTMEEGGVDPRPTSNANAGSVSGSGRKKWILAAAAIAVVAALSLGLGFGLSGDNDSSSNNKSSSNSLQQNNTNTSSGEDNGSSGTPIGGGIPISSKLTAVSSDTISQKYPSCEDLAKDLTEMAWLIANRTIESNLWYFDPNLTYAPGIAEEGVAGEDLGSGAPSGDAPEKQVTESSYGTNNQEAGVEEGDIVQSNGEQVFVVYGSEILVLAADAVTLTSRTTIPKPDAEECYSVYISNMILIGERLVVIASSYCGFVVPLEGDEAAKDLLPYPIGQENVRALIYDTTDMSVVTTVMLNGTYAAARAIGDDVHIVTSTYLDSYPLTQYLEPWRTDIYGENITEAQYRRKAKVQVEAHIEEYVASLIQKFDCTGVSKIALFQNSDDSFSFTGVLDSFATVTSFTVSSPSTTKSTSSVFLPSGGYTIYASAQLLAMVVQGWWLGDSASQQQSYLISYTLNGPSAVATAFGSVPGYVLNQFSIDHVVQGGVDYLRVATSTFEEWAEVDGVWSVVADTTSQVSVLKIEDGAAEMSIVGQLTDLGKTGETIYSVRFLGDRGFVTTYKTTDPFYTIDMSDPTNPTKVGELEILGFSNNLQPIGDNFILGVGQSADANGTVLGVEISLFDVSDFSNPVRIQQFADVGSTNVSSSSYSDAQYDWKSMRYLNDSQLLILPLTIYTYAVCNYTIAYPDGNDTSSSPPSDGGGVSTSSEGDEAPDSGNATDIFIDPFPTCLEPAGGFDGFRVYEIKSSGIKPYLSIAHDLGNWFGCWGGAFLQSRSLVFDGDLMTLKGHTILSHDLSTLLQDATPINLDDKVTVCEPYILF